MLERFSEAAPAALKMQIIPDLLRTYAKAHFQVQPHADEKQARLEFGLLGLFEV